MKKFLLIIFFILIINSVLAIEIDLNKEEYRPGETLLGEIEGNFLTPISSSNIYFYEDTLRIPLVYDLLKVEDKYYIYAILPEEVRNYTLKIKDVHHMVGLNEITEDLTTNFSVEGSLVSFLISPGFILTQNSFEIKIINNVGRITINSEFNNIQDSFEIKAGDTEKIKFNTNFSNFTVTSLKLYSGNTSYDIPIIILPEARNITKEIFEANKLRFSSSSINFLSYINTALTKETELINFGENNLTVDIEASENLQELLSISPSSFELEKGDRIEINLTIFSDEEGDFSGSIKASSDNFTTDLFIEIKITSNITEINSSIIAETKTCSELEGRFCIGGESCDGNTTYTSDGYCCLSTCSIPTITSPKSSSIWKYIGIVFIILVLAAGGFFIYKKYMRKPKSPDELIKERELKYSDKLSLNKPQQTRGNLTKN